MKKSELIDAVAERSGQSKAAVTAVLDALADVTAGALKEGQALTLPGLSKFEVRERGARTVRNPQTGATMEKPATRVVTVKPVKSIKDAVAA